MPILPHLWEEKKGGASSPALSHSTITSEDAWRSMLSPEQIAQYDDRQPPNPNPERGERQICRVTEARPDRLTAAFEFYWYPNGGRGFIFQLGGVSRCIHAADDEGDFVTEYDPELTALAILCKLRAPSGEHWVREKAG